MRFIVQIVSNNILQQIPTIILTCDYLKHRKKYLFNVPEHFSRYIKLHNLKYAAGMNIFFTKYSAQSISGLPRLFLQLNQTRSQNSKCYDTKVYFDDSSFKYWRRMKRYMGFRMVSYSFFNLNTGELLLGLKNSQQSEVLIANNKMRFMRGQYTNQELKDIVKQPSDASSFVTLAQPDKQGAKQQNRTKYYYESDGGHMKIFTIGNNQQAFYNYIFTTNEIPGRVNAQILQNLVKQHNLSNQQRISLLKQNQIILPNGQILSSTPFRQNKSSRHTLYILHYRTVQNIKQILDNPILNKQLRNSQANQNDESNSCIVHIVQGDGSLIFTSQFVQLKNKLGGKYRHVVYNRLSWISGSPQELKRQLQIFYPHFKLCRDMRRISNGFVRDLSSNVMKIYEKYVLQKIAQQKQTSILKQITPYKMKHQLTLVPVRLQGYQKPDIYPQQYFFKFPNSKMPQKNPTPYQKQLAKKLQIITKQIDPKVIFLGTSSMLSTLYRNVSGIMIKFQHKQLNQTQKNNNEDWSLLMDCGDGVYQQFINHFGANYQDQLIKVRVLFLSHIHIDHVAGVFKFISKRNKILEQRFSQPKDRNRQKLFVIMPKNIVCWFQQFNLTIQKIDKYCEVIFAQSLSNLKLLKVQQYFEKLNVSVFKKAKKPNTQQSLKKQGQINQSNQKPSKQNQKSKQIIQQSKQKQKSTEMLTLEECMSDQQMILQQNQDEMMKINQNNQLAYRQKLIQMYTTQQKQSVSRLKTFLHLKNMQQFLPVPVVHCGQSYGLVLQHKSNLKISYSGDCRPTSQFINLAKKSTLMIHQSTFNSKQRQKAKKYWHSTSSQAVEIGFKSDSLMTALTHFNCRFGTNQYGNQKIELIDAKVQLNYKKYNVFKAVDHLEFKISQMHLLPYATQKISMIY